MKYLILSITRIIVWLAINIKRGLVLGENKAKVNAAKGSLLRYSFLILYSFLIDFIFVFDIDFY